MTMTPTSEQIAADEKESKLRAQWLNDHDAPKDWVVVTVDELAFLKKCFWAAQKCSENRLTALKAVMGDIDFTKGNCRMTDMVGACLSKESLALAPRRHLRSSRGRGIIYEHQNRN